MIKKKLKIEGMDCPSCAMMLDGDLEDLEGIACARTNFAKAEVELEYDADKVKETDIEKIVEKAGFGIGN